MVSRLAIAEEKIPRNRARAIASSFPSAAGREDDQTGGPVVSGTHDARGGGGGSSTSDDSRCCCEPSWVQTFAISRKASRTSLSLVSSAHRRHSRAKVRHSSAGMKRPSTRTKRSGEKSRWWEQKDTIGTSRPARRYPPSMGQIVGWVGSQYDSTPKKFRRRCHNSEGPAAD